MPMLPQMSQSLSPAITAVPLHAFMDAFQGCYKDGTNGTRDCRYFAGLQLVLRLLFPVIFSLQGKPSLLLYYNS